MIGSVPNIGFAITASRNGRMSVPVSPSAYIYSQFKHVSGVPAPEGTQGVAVSKLKILDVLIEQLSRIKRTGGGGAGMEVSDEKIDALIKQYENQIRSAYAVQSEAAKTAASYALAPGAASTGAIFSIAA